MIKLSIIVPIYNGKRYLRECLDSVVICPMEDIECILVNDGSKDCSLDICKEFCEKDARFYLLNQENQGVSMARNNGIKLASGKYLLFLDADDYMDINSWATIKADVEREENDFIAYSYHTLYESGQTKEERLCDQDVVQDKNEITKLIYASSRLNTCWGKIFLTEVIQSNQLQFRPDLKIGEDFIFVADYYSHCSTPLLKGKSILYYRQHGESAMHKYDMVTRLGYLKTLYEYNQEKVGELADQKLSQDMNYYYLCMITDLFLDFAKRSSKDKLRESYQAAIKREPVTTIITNIESKDINKLYKKVEYHLLHKKKIRALIGYFRFKARLDQRH